MAIEGFKVKTNFLLMVLTTLASLPSLSQTPGDTSQVEGTNFLNRIPIDQSWEAQNEHKAWTERQNDIEQMQKEADSFTANLNNEIAAKSLEATNSDVELEALRQHFLDLKKIIPRDPWREIYGDTKYVNSPNSGFVRCQRPPAKPEA